MNIYNVDEVVFGSRGEAEKVLDMMNKLAETYGAVRVSNYYELADRESAYIDNKYGWFPDAMRKVVVARVRNGYILNLPRVLPVESQPSYTPYYRSTPKPTYKPYNPTPKPDSSPEPLNITINTDSADDDILSEVFKHVRTIKDRPILISII